MRFVETMTGAMIVHLDLLAPWFSNSVPNTTLEYVMGFLRAMFGAPSKAPASISENDRTIGNFLLAQYKRLIKNKTDAMNAALSVYWYGQSQFIQDDNGSIIRASESAIVVPTRLKLFADKFYDEEDLVTDRAVVGLTYELTRNIEDQRIQIETIYAIAEDILDSYSI